MQYIEAGAPTEIKTNLPAIFLAGGITDCPDWQADVVEHLKGEDVALLNPRRANFPIHDPAASEEQIAWEFHALRRVDVILFWFPAGPAVQPIALFELGYWLGQNKPLVIGRDDSYLRRADVDVQVRLARSLKVENNLSVVAAKAARIAADWR